MPNISPILPKDAIVSLDPTLGICLGIITFQHDPGTLTRR
jgi:hypothetical protein